MQSSLLDAPREMRARKVAQPSLAAEPMASSPGEMSRKLRETAESLNDAMSMMNVGITFGYDDKTNEMYVSVIENGSRQVIRQIPPKEALELKAKMKELVGLIFDRTI